MIKLECIIHKFEQQGEKTGWTYVTISPDAASKLHPESKKSFRVKGTMDGVPFAQLALLPMGEGEYILPLNGALRKAIKKQAGQLLALHLEADHSEFLFSPEMMACLEEDPHSLAQFNTLAGSHQKYFSKWVDSAKGMDTKATRISRVLFAMQNKLNYAEMMRHFKSK
jgi:hypothetical protein